MTGQQQQQQEKAAYVAVARRKQEQLESQIPSGWRLTSEFLPNASTTPGKVLDVPRRCGLLTPREIEITENWDIRGLLGELGSGRLKAEDAMLAFSKRSAIAHQLTSCLTEPLFTRALKQAKRLDEHLSKTGSTIGPLHGLPISVKDTFDIEGVDSSIGIAAFCFKPAKANAPLVDVLESLGCVIVAKTNVPQTLGALDSVNNIFGRTMNPLNRKVTAGGSSGGEGVLVRMRGSMIGFGTDVGGSIRIPAMCNGIFGLKPSVGRLPFGGQQSGQPDGISRLGMQAVAGPIAYSVSDIDTVMSAIQSASPWDFIGAEDVLPWTWTSSSSSSSSSSPPIPPDHLLTTPPKKYVVGVLASDGLTHPLPPIQHLLSNLAATLRSHPNVVSIIDIPTPPAWTACQSVGNALMSPAGSNDHMLDILSSHDEPLIPWLQGRLRRGKPHTLESIRRFQARRLQLEREMHDIWTYRDGATRNVRIDTIICPVAPHPVPPLDGYNAVNYTSSFVLLDWPAGVVPIRDFDETDLDLDWLGGVAPDVVGSWDRRNRELWWDDDDDDEKKKKTTPLGEDGRRVYLGTPLCVQVLGRRGDERGAWEGMRLVHEAVRREKEMKMKEKGVGGRARL